MRAADPGHREVFHEERIVADGPPELVGERFLFDVVALEYDSAAPDLVQEIDAQRTAGRQLRFDQDRQGISPDEIWDLGYRPVTLVIRR